MNYKRIWRSGALAVVVTIAFAMFVFRVADWTKGLNSEFLVYGQTGAAAVGSSGTSGGTSVTKVIPQIAVGSFDGGATKYTTVIEIVNTNSTAVTVSGNFYTQTGAASPVSLTGVSGGVLPTMSIAGNSVLVVKGEPAQGTTTGTIAWGKLVTTGTVSIASFFEIRDGLTNVLYSRVGVQASSANMASFVIPRTRNVAAGLDVAFAVVNTGSTGATLNATLKDATGAAISTKSIVLNAGQQTALFTQQFFALTNEASGSNYHYVVFDGGNAAQFAAIALAFEGATQTSFPVDQLR